MPIPPETTPIQPVLLCGGAGTRLWPLSRESYPKQFLSLDGEGTMLQQTAHRLDALAPGIKRARSLIVVCNAAHRFIAAQQLLEAGIAESRLLLEPVGRNTAPALTLAALDAVRDGGDPVLLAMPSDHVMRDRAAFCRAVECGLPAAEGGAMLTFGITPSRPETGFGYIRTGEPDGEQPLNVEAFVEKPDLETAGAYVRSGRYLWNSGIFMVRASVWLRAVANLQPEIDAACREAMTAAEPDRDFLRPDAAAFANSPSDSIDYAVMEQLPGNETLGIPALVVPLDAGWSDLGAWDGVHDVAERDEHGNVIHGDTLVVDSRDTLVHATSRLVAVSGVEGLVVVETPDAVLVTTRKASQHVRQLVSRLRVEGRVLADTHRKVHRPWGWYDSIDAGERFQVKRIVVNPGASLSLQMHHHRAEHWIVVRGTAEVTNGEKVFILTENESTFIPLGHVHRLANPGKVPLEIVEVQSGGYLGEDDIVRFEDSYGRANETKESSGHSFDADARAE
ncbi:MAG: mannose-1-phosphate guanylyltransferase/mannose-6-phosphate isomerase [Azoarcus sp.]|nr:mannose-1-phosphate guanylyltransferase/mannose-6-phosphate isomerase [Azoarcus sp.]